MNTKHLQRQFDQIGVQFAAKTHEAVHHCDDFGGWRSRLHRPELRIKHQRCVLVYEASFREQLDVTASRVNGANDMLLLTIAYFNTRFGYLCQVSDGRMVTRQLELNERQDVEKEAQAFRKLTAAPRSRKKQQRKNHAISYTAANQHVPMTERQYEAYIRLTRACRNAKFMQETKPVIGAYGEHVSNTYLTALMRIAKFHEQWQREPAFWKAGSRNPEKAFQNLLAHLFAHYPVPGFLATVWFRRREDWLPCYIEVSQGATIRKVLALQFPLTKKMAHHVMAAPDRYTMEEALRWGQVQGLGGNERFYAAIRRTRITPAERNNPDGHAFWQTVMEWFLKHPMLATAHYGPLVDYIRREKGRDGEFKIAGRSPQVLLRAVEAWHAELNTSTRRAWKTAKSWKGHNLDWWWSQKQSADESIDWRMTEILRVDRLRLEGVTMRHCVYSYDWECGRGKLAIFSLQRDGRPTLTVEYVPKTRQIGEVRGNMNRIPTAEEWAILKRWALAKNLG